MPKLLWVRMEKLRNGGEDIYPYDNLADAVDGDGPTTIGVYKLTGTIKRKKIVADAK